jgi:hypothetical protein
MRATAWENTNLEELDREGLLDLQAKVCESLDAIKTQLDEAKANAAQNGNYSDADWFRRAQSAQRWRGRFHQKIQARLSALKKETKERNLDEARKESLRFERTFFSLASKMLPAPLFASIVEAATERMEEQNGKEESKEETDQQDSVSAKTN